MVCGLSPTLGKQRIVLTSADPLAVRSPQVVYKVYEDAELKPLLDAVNAEQSKEKEKEGGS